MANKFKVTGTKTKSITLTKAQTRVYEGSGSAGDSFRRDAKDKARELVQQTGKPVEIYSHDGITFEHFSLQREDET